MLASRLLNRLITVGSLRLMDADGITHRFQGANGPGVFLRLNDRALHHKLFFNTSLAFGEAYVDGRLTVENCDIYAALELFGRNLEAMGQSGLNGWMGGVYRLLRWIRQFNPVPRARKNAAHHYNLTETFYDLFLDSDKQYSCAYFERPKIGLDEAQRAKRRLIAAKLLLEPGMRVLDIGCGWGGLALHLAREADVEVTGLTLSEEQLKAARRRAREQGLADRVQFHLRDYREEAGRYDRVVSVGMFEHVGIAHYRRYFAQVRDLLTADGVALIHTIGRADGPGFTDPWIDKYIFPGGYIPALSEIAPAIEKAGLWTTDLEVLRLHYAETIRHWRGRFARNRDKARALYDERFCRLWEYYLAVSEVSFRYLATTVFQIQLAKRQDAVPLTRDYLVEKGQEKGRRIGGAEHAAGSRAA